MRITEPPVKITDNLWMLGSHEYPLYLVRGDSQAAIFEGGTGPMGPLFCEQLGELGIDGELIRQLVIPHAHPDHVMAVPSLREALPRIKVLASEIAARTLAAEKAVGFFCKIDQAITGSLLERGIIREEHKPPPLDPPRIPVDGVIGEGDTISVDGMSFRVLATPGHSECSLSFHDPDREVLFVSDAVGYYMEEHDYWWPNYFTGYGTYIDSIERLAALDAEILCQGHHGVIQGTDDVRAHFIAAVSATGEYHRRIIDDVKSGRPVREIAEQLGSEVHEKTQLLPLEFFQKNCSVLVKQSLKHEGIDQ